MTAPAGNIRETLPCSRCGYDLRGLSAETACPECAQPVSLTLAGDGLDRAEPTWRRRVGRALLFAGILALVPIVLRPPIAGWIRFAVPWRLAMGLTWVCQVIVPASLVIATWPEPGRASTAPGQRARRLARIGAVVLLLLAGVGAATGLGFVRLPTGSSMLVLMAVYSCASVLVQMLALLAVLFWLRDVARRSGRSRLVGLVRTVILGLPPATLLQLVLLGFWVVDGAAGSRGGTGPSAAVTARMQVAILIWSWLAAAIGIALATTYGLVGHGVLRSSRSDRAA